MRQNISEQFSIGYALWNKTATISGKYDLKSHKVQTYKNHKSLILHIVRSKQTRVISWEQNCISLSR